MGVNRTGVDQFQLRLPAGLRDRVKEKADANGRSANAEIVAAIEAALEQPDLSASQLRALLDEEREAATRSVGIIESQFDLIDRYKHILDSAGRQISRQAGVMESLCTIILSLNPTQEIVEMAKRVSDAARDEREKFEEKYGVDPDRTDPARLERQLSRVSEATKKPKR